MRGQCLIGHLLSSQSLTIGNAFATDGTAERSIQGVKCLNGFCPDFDVACVATDKNLCLVKVSRNVISKHGFRTCDSGTRHWRNCANQPVKVVVLRFGDATTRICHGLHVTKLIVSRGRRGPTVAVSGCLLHLDQLVPVVIAVIGGIGGIAANICRPRGIPRKVEPRLCDGPSSIILNGSKDNAIQCVIFEARDMSESISLAGQVSVDVIDDSHGSSGFEIVGKRVRTGGPHQPVQIVVGRRRLTAQLVSDANHIADGIKLCFTYESPQPRPFRTVRMRRPGENRTSQGIVFKVCGSAQSISRLLDVAEQIVRCHRRRASCACAIGNGW